MIIKVTVLNKFYKCDNLDWLKRSSGLIFYQSAEQLTYEDAKDYLEKLNIGKYNKYLKPAKARLLNNLLVEYYNYKFDNDQVKMMVGYRLIATTYLYALLLSIGKSQNSKRTDILYINGTPLGSAFNRVAPLFETLDYTVDELAKKKFRPGDLKLVQTVMRRIFAGEMGDSSDV